MNDELTPEQIQQKRSELAEKVRKGEPLTSQERTWINGADDGESEEVTTSIEKVLKRKYKMSPAALDQRRVQSKRIRDENLATGPITVEGKAHSSQNARKHGLYAEQFLHSAFFKPCLSTCPNYPCELVDNESTKPGMQCLSRHHFMDALSAIQQAIVDGKMDAFNELAAVELAGQFALSREMLEHIGSQGLMQESTEPGANGVIKKLKIHPAVDALTKLYKVMGTNLPEFMVTSRSQDRANTNRALVESLASKTSKAGKKLEALRSVQHEDQEDDS